MSSYAILVQTSDTMLHQDDYLCKFLVKQARRDENNDI